MGMNNRLRAFFGHHKSASTWVEMICKEVCRELGIRVESAWSASLFDHDLPRFVEDRKVRFFSYTNANFNHVRQLENVLGFHVVRDPRDICVSAYFSHLTSHPTRVWPELKRHRQELESLSKSKGLLSDMRFMQPFFDDMRSWCEEREDILEVQMEELTAHPYENLLRIFRHLQMLDESDFSPSKRLFFVLSKTLRRVEHMSGYRLSIPIAPRNLAAERLLGIVWDNDFKRISGGREKGEEDPSSHYRKGVAGDWRNHFGKEHVDFFKERYGDILIQYGYEKSSEWS